MAQTAPNADQLRVLDNAAAGIPLNTGFGDGREQSAARRAIAVAQRKGWIEEQSLTDAGRAILDIRDGFKPGDVVEWSSQAAGIAKTKRGVVAEVLRPDARPSRERFPQLYTGSGVGFGRPDVSYVVLVGTRPYWPRTAALRRSR